MDLSTLGQGLNEWTLHDVPAWLAHATPHWLRPRWLWALAGVLPLWVVWRRRQRHADVWAAHVDAHLQPQVLEPATTGMRRVPWLAGLAWVLAVLALAGPSWQRVPPPAFERSAPLVIALDLSSATRAADLPPSRLLQARAKIADILRRRTDGEVGLVAYAGDAFTVAPLTDDPANVALFLDALSPDVMPMDGSDAARAIVQARRLIRDAGAARGDILLMTDHADAAAIGAAAAAHAAGDRVSVLGLGTLAGAPFRDGNDRLATARLQPARLAALATAGGGRYVAATVGARDIDAFDATAPVAAAAAVARESGVVVWADQGYWLLLPLLLLGLFGFRRGLVVLAFAAWLPWAPAARAADGWWQRSDQMQAARMQQGDAAYAGGDYTAAADAWARLPGATAAYNLGNAEAMRGDYAAAIRAYQRALALQPGMADAAANLRLLQQAARQQAASRQSASAQARSQGSSQGGSPGTASPPTSSPPAQPSTPSPGDAAARTGNASPPPPESRGASRAAAPEQPAARRSAPRRDTPPDAGPNARPASPSHAGTQAGQGAPTPPEMPAQSTGTGNVTAPAAQIDTATARAAQAAADAAQRARMQTRLGDQSGRDAGVRGAAGESHETPAERAERQAVQAQLQRVVDDPGELLRRRFLLEARRREEEGASPP